MNAKTLKATKGSVRKWERLARGEGLDRANANCPLCKLFYGDPISPSPGDCAGCPVMEKTGKQYCVDTPYASWIDRVSTSRYGRFYGKKAETDREKRLARKERDFLRSLLPKKRVARKKK